MNIGRSLIGSFGAVLIGLVAMAPGCEAEDPTTGDDQNVTPDGASDQWDLAALCQQNITRHASVKAQELTSGIIRWQCGDREGVDGEADRGQEYCEYHAVSKGKKVMNFADVDAASPLSCYFTTVYYDVDGNGGSVGTRDAELATELSKPENFNATVAPELVRMKGRFNSRGAATTLINDAVGVEQDTNENRQAACFLASLKFPDKAEQFKKLCRGVNLASKSAWSKVTKLGAGIPTKTTSTDYDQYKDLTACMSVGRLQNGGVDWRMSDPHITQIVVRANQECLCTYSELPAGLDGFLQGTWSSADALPPGCRRAKVDGEDYQHVTICDVPEAERADLELDLDYSENLQAFCNDRFGKDIVLTAPLRAVETAGSCSKSTGTFCTEFTKNAN